MCLICIEFNKGRLTMPEALNNAREMKNDSHFIDIIQLVWDKMSSEDQGNLLDAMSKNELQKIMGERDGSSRKTRGRDVAAWCDSWGS